MKKVTSSASSQFAKRQLANAAAMKRARKLPAHLRKELKMLEAVPDDQIDTSDIPEITDAEWARRETGPLYRPIKKSITIRLDTEVVEWFRAKGPGYQTAMNRVLRNYFASHR
jgi:uncharacterized protein (DUF4415 family)